MEISQMPNTNPPPKKMNSKILVLLVVVVVLSVFGVTAFWFVTQQDNSVPTPINTSTESAQIRDNSDLNEVEKTLDSADVDALGDELEQNDTDAAEF